MDAVGGGVDALGWVGDGVSAFTKLASGDAVGMWGDVAGFNGGGLFFVGCEAVMLGGTVPTAGASTVGGQAVCFAGSWGAGEAASSVVEWAAG
ncbi:hypothetical protein ACFWZ2_05060 [Streptomyces sp. NPDC059002]|uniref:hypothetical protein n=1 Tax=Streptomyces sp. NPDC059002 TaxID=3346690 RepID=UPI00368CF151